MENPYAVKLTDEETIEYYMYAIDEYKKFVKTLKRHVLNRDDIERIPYTALKYATENYKPSKLDFKSYLKSVVRKKALFEYKWRLKCIQNKVDEELQRDFYTDRRRKNKISVLDEVNTKLANDFLASKVAKLSQVEQNVIKKYFWEEKTITEISNETQSYKQEVRYVIVRSIRKLRDLLFFSKDFRNMMDYTYDMSKDAP